jgi:hypothetical protein
MKAIIASIDLRPGAIRVTVDIEGSPAAVDQLYRGLIHGAKTAAARHSLTVDESWFQISGSRLVATIPDSWPGQRQLAP